MSIKQHLGLSSWEADFRLTMKNNKKKKEYTTHMRKYTYFSTRKIEMEKKTHKSPSTSLYARKHAQSGNKVKLFSSLSFLLITDN